MEKSLIECFLPEGTLEYFDIAGVEKSSEGFTISLIEKNLHPEEFIGQKLTSKGFYDEITLKDFPIRGKACYLKVKRRRWYNEDMSKVVSRNWELVAKGTRMTREFATFLKGMHRFYTS